LRILVTAGGTEEPVDGVRRLTNISTGATGGVLSRFFAEAGAEVLLLHAERAPLDEIPVRQETFLSFADLSAVLRGLLEERPWDAVVHLAAVSDYSIAAIEVDGRPVAPGATGKIGTGREVQALVDRGTADLVVHNDLREIDEDRHPAVIHGPTGPLVRTETKEELARALFQLLQRKTL